MAEALQFPVSLVSGRLVMLLLRFEFCYTHSQPIYNFPFIKKQNKRLKLCQTPTVKSRRFEAWLRPTLAWNLKFKLCDSANFDTNYSSNFCHGTHNSHAPSKAFLAFTQKGQKVLEKIMILFLPICSCTIDSTAAILLPLRDTRSEKESSADDEGGAVHDNVTGASHLAGSVSWQCSALYAPCSWSSLHIR